MHLERGHIHVGHNSLAGASYAAFFAMCGFEGVTGFALYGETNPGGFWDKLAAGRFPCWAARSVSTCGITWWLG
jgi:Ni/Fe-hydrogenase 1 B-type cytochrome subunit